MAREPATNSYQGSARVVIISLQLLAYAIPACFVLPPKAGIQGAMLGQSLGFRFHGSDDDSDMQLLHAWIYATRHWSPCFAVPTRQRGAAFGRYEIDRSQGEYWRNVSVANSGCAWPPDGNLLG